MISEERRLERSPPKFRTFPLPIVKHSWRTRWLTSQPKEISAPTTLQAVADALADSLKTAPDSSKLGGAFDELAQLQRYEHVKVSLKSPEYAAAIRKLDDIEASRYRADFTLEDLEGKSWTLSALKGKVVLVNFWATWCPPCRKEMPDLDRLYSEFKDQGLVILAISDEKKETVTSYLATHPVNYIVLLDPARKANDAFKMAGIPNSYIFDRKGHLVAEAEDMRTRPQFLKLLSKAGLSSSPR